MQNCANSKRADTLPKESSYNKRLRSALWFLDKPLVLLVSLVEVIDSCRVFEDVE